MACRSDERPAALPAAGRESAVAFAFRPANVVSLLMIRTFIGAAFLTLFILIVGLPIIAYSALTGSSDELYRVGKWGIAAAMRLAGARVRAEGLENIPSGVCIFAANHVSNLDPPA